MNSEQALDRTRALRMTLLIGTDEAGYGPNLGPLVISATAWRIPDEQGNADLFDVLSSVVGRASEPGRLAIADSKLLYKPGGGLAALEQGVLAAWHASASGSDGGDSRPLRPGPVAATGELSRLRSWREAWRSLAPAVVSCFDGVPWYADYDEPLPIDADAKQIVPLADHFGAALGAAGMGLECIRATAVLPAKFNRLLERHTSKGTALSHETLTLVKQVMECSPATRILIRCDKHGGRNRYGPLLQTLFPEYLVEIVREGREQSIYRWGPESRRVEIRFIAKCESQLPAALASMVSKYLRELAMRAFNAFWKTHVADLRPTAGYPVDARRFKQQIQKTQVVLGVDDGLLWRNK